MSNKRELKKDIRALIEMVIADALELSVSFEKEIDREKVLNLIVKTANLHNDLIARVNHPDGEGNRHPLYRFNRNQVLSGVPPISLACQGQTAYLTSHGSVPQS